MATVLETTRAFHFQQISEHCAQLGHKLKPIPPFRYNRTKTTCEDCGLACHIRTRKIPLPGGKVNNQIKAEGPVMVQVCTRAMN